MKVGVAEEHQKQAFKRLVERRVVPSYRRLSTTETARLLAAMLGHRIRPDHEPSAREYLAQQYLDPKAKKPKTTQEDLFR